MDIDIKKSFSKDIDKILNKKILKSVFEAIENIQAANSIREIKNLKKLHGSKKHFRIRIGEYRMGLLIEGNTVFIVRVLPPKDIYRFFP